MTKLIVAVDGPARCLRDLIDDAGVRFFKFNAASLMTSDGRHAIEFVEHRGCDVFLDLKVYDVPDTVAAVAHHAFNALSARFLTVYADPAMLAAATSVSRAEQQKVIAVRSLTSSPEFLSTDDIRTLDAADGLVFNYPASVSWARTRLHPSFTGVSVLPGVRRATDPPHHHARPTTPEAARAAGVDYTVVGRPITRAEDPVAAALEFRRLLGRVMDERTLAALRGSIEKWEAIVAGTGSDHGAENCPLCAIFHWDYVLARGSNVEMACTGCPVRETTGLPGCAGSPYDDLYHYDSRTNEYREAAKRELEFLRSLLPESAP